MSEFQNDKDIIIRKREKRKRIKRKKKLYNTIIIVLCLVLVVCIYNIGSYFWQDFSNKNMNEDLAGEYVSYNQDGSTDPSNSSNTGDGQNPSGGTSVKKEIVVPDSIDFEKLKAQNEDVVGWIFSKNGVINYPILQGSDNSYYLNHLLNGKKNINGSIFMDCDAKSDFSGANTIIYGHSMDNGSMFRTLLNYKKKSYYEKYPEMYIFTPNGKYKLVIFSAYETTSSDLAYINIYGQAGFNKFVSHAFAKSKFKTNVEVGVGDRLVTLSTCAYSSEKARFLVIGKLVSADEEESNSQSTTNSQDYYGSFLGG